MRWVKILGFCALLIFTLCIVPPCYAMIEKEEEYYTTEGFGFKVKRIIATETDGTMIWGKQYDMTIIVTLTYINKETIQYLKLKLNETRLNPIFEFTYIMTGDCYLYDVGDSVEIPTAIRCADVSASAPFINDLGLMLSFYSYNNLLKVERKYSYYCEPIYIEFRRETFQNEIIDYISSLEAQLNNISNLLYALILTTTILIATTVYLAIRKPKVKVEEKQEN